ncbi:MAG TPA: hypothetical protein VJ302_38020 [Blastocatellia bacterium]|nr:hypothetical protein [Blastocatellia bacterium]
MLALSQSFLFNTRNNSSDGRRDEIVETPIDLRPALKNGLGHAVLVIESVSGTGPMDGPQVPRLIPTWIQSTEIAVDAFADRAQLLVWANSLKDGRPIEGVQLELIEPDRDGRPVERASGKTGVDGLAKIPRTTW